MLTNYLSQITVLAAILGILGERLGFLSANDQAIAPKEIMPDCAHPDE